MVSDDEIRHILLTEWDPLSIGENPNLSSEYDDFIPQIRKAILDGENSNFIASILLTMEKNLGHFEWGGASSERAAEALSKLSSYRK